MHRLDRAVATGRSVEELIVLDKGLTKCHKPKKGRGD